MTSTRGAHLIKCSPYPRCPYPIPRELPSRDHPLVYTCTNTSVTLRSTCGRVSFSSLSSLHVICSRTPFSFSGSTSRNYSNRNCNLNHLSRKRLWLLMVSAGWLTNTTDRLTCGDRPCMRKFGMSPTMMTSPYQDLRTTVLLWTSISVQHAT